jgi:hypothetical protein
MPFSSDGASEKGERLDTRARVYKRSFHKRSLVAVPAQSAAEHVVIVYWILQSWVPNSGLRTACVDLTKCSRRPRLTCEFAIHGVFPTTRATCCQQSRATCIHAQQQYVRLSLYWPVSPPLPQSQHTPVHDSPFSRPTKFPLPSPFGPPLSLSTTSTPPRPSSTLPLCSTASATPSMSRLLPCRNGRDPINRRIITVCSHTLLCSPTLCPHAQHLTRCPHTRHPTVLHTRHPTVLHTRHLAFHSAAPHAAASASTAPFRPRDRPRDGHLPTDHHLAHEHGSLLIPIACFASLFHTRLFLHWWAPWWGRR